MVGARYHLQALGSIDCVPPSSASWTTTKAGPSSVLKLESCSISCPLLPKFVLEASPNVRNGRFRSRATNLATPARASSGRSRSSPCSPGRPGPRRRARRWWPCRGRGVGCGSFAKRHAPTKGGTREARCEAAEVRLESRGGRHGRRGWRAARRRESRRRAAPGRCAKRRPSPGRKAAQAGPDRSRPDRPQHRRRKEPAEGAESRGRALRQLDQCRTSFLHRAERRRLARHEPGDELARSGACPTMPIVAPSGGCVAIRERRLAERRARAPIRDRSSRRRTPARGFPRSGARVCRGSSLAGRVWARAGEDRGRWRSFRRGRDRSTAAPHPVAHYARTQRDLRPAHVVRGEAAAISHRLSKRDLRPPVLEVEVTNELVLERSGLAVTKGLVVSCLERLCRGPCDVGRIE